MSQNFSSKVLQVFTGGIGFLLGDPLDAALVDNGPQKAALDQTAQAVIKTGPGRFFGILVSAPGSTSGAWAVNDCATTGAIAAGNLLGEVAYNNSVNAEGNLLLGAVQGGIPFENGLVLSVPGGSPVGVVLYS